MGCEMDIRQLKYFRTVAEEGQISGAAKKLFMAQPSLSQQLKLLEAELEVRLVERGSRRVRLTEAGQLLYERAGQVLDLLQTTATEIKDLQEGHKGTLTIGSIASSGVTLLPGLIKAFHQRYPQVNFQLYEGDTTRILDLLNNGLLEVGIVRSASSFDPDCYSWIDLSPEPMIVAMHISWDKERLSEALSLRDLAHQPLLLHRSNEMMVTDACRQVGFEPHILCKGEDVRSLLVLANDGLGLALVPKSALGLVPCADIIYKPISDSTIKKKKALVWMRQRYLSAPAKLFVQSVCGEDAGDDN